MIGITYYQFRYQVMIYNDIHIYILPVYIKDHTDNGIFVYIYLKSKLIE
jgi:hypothetical protein